MLAEERTAMSLKYQVLCAETAIVGVMKQEERVSEAILEQEAELGKSL